MVWLRDAWYMGGWADEVGPAGLARRIADKPIFFFRLADGSVAALLDRCPHRFAPLSRGVRDGDRVVCGYHGLAFSAEGKCVYNPFSDRAPAGSDIPSYKVVVKDDIVWLWGGAPERADLTCLPDFSFIPDASYSRTIRGYTLMRANYEYGTDNLLDLSHIEFVHKGTFAGQGVIFAGEHSVKVDGNTLFSNWWMPNISPPSMAQDVFPADTRVDHWLDMRWNAPATMRLNVGVTPHGADRGAGLEIPQAHILTPADEDTTHYFWSSTRFHELDSPDTDEMLRTMFANAFDMEDKPIIEAAYANVRGRDFWKEKPVSLGIDQGGTRARRLLERMILQENAVNP